MTYHIKKLLFVFLSVIMISGMCCSCQWQPAPEIIKNTIGLQKHELSQTDIQDGDYKEVYFFIANKSGYTLELNFCGEDYCFLTQGAVIDIMRKRDMKETAYLLVHRPVRKIAGTSIKMNGEDFLVLYVGQRPTTSSTLFILDKNFSVVYRERLLGANALGYGSSPRYENFIIVKSDNIWWPDGIDKPGVRINGNWLYYKTSQ